MQITTECSCYVAKSIQKRNVSTCHYCSLIVLWKKSIAIAIAIRLTFHYYASPPDPRQ